MIHLTRIDKWFGSHQVLKGIDLQLAEGSVTALIGPSGSGKSTPLRCVNLLEIPQVGELRLGDGQHPLFRSVMRRVGRRSRRSGNRPGWCSRTSSCFLI